MSCRKKRWKRFQDAYGLNDSCLAVCTSKPRKVKGLKKRKIEDREAEDEKDEEKKDSGLRSGDESLKLEDSQT